MLMLVDKHESKGIKEYRCCIFYVLRLIILNQALFEKFVKPTQLNNYCSLLTLLIFKNYSKSISNFLKKYQTC